MQIRAGGGHGTVAERGLDQMDGRAMVQRVAGMRVPQPVRTDVASYTSFSAALRRITLTLPRSRVRRYWTRTPVPHAGTLAQFIQLLPNPR